MAGRQRISSMNSRHHMSDPAISGSKPKEGSTCLSSIPRELHKDRRMTTHPRERSPTCPVVRADAQQGCLLHAE